MEVIRSQIIIVYPPLITVIVTFLHIHQFQKVQIITELCPGLQIMTTIAQCIQRTIYRIGATVCGKMTKQQLHLEAIRLTMTMLMQTQNCLSASTRCLKLCDSVHNNKTYNIFAACIYQTKMCQNTLFLYHNVLTEIVLFLLYYLYVLIIYMYTAIQCILMSSTVYLCIFYRARFCTVYFAWSQRLALSSPHCHAAVHQRTV